MLPLESSELAKAIKSGEIRISVYGMGLVGSAIAAVWLRFGATVIAVDVDEEVVERVSKGIGPRLEPLVSQAFKKAIKEGRLKATTNGSEAARESKIKFVAVPVGLKKDYTADLAHLKSVLKLIADNLSEGDAVIVKPTLPIGTSRRLAIPILESSGLKADEEFFYVYSPERVSAGRAVKDIEEHYPIIVSGAGPRSLEFGANLYRLVAKAGVIKMSSMEAAEAEKIFEGVYRDVNIALANELAIISSKLGLDFEEIRSAANSQPYSNIHKPGLGVGGACIPVYPWFLINDSLRFGIIPKLILTAREINLGMPEYFARLIASEFEDINGKVVTVLGLAYRGNVADKRFSPTYDLVAKLIRFGKPEIRVHDPYFDRDDFLNKLGVTVTSDLKLALLNADIIVVATDHNEYKGLDSETIISHAGKRPVIIDARGVLDHRKLKGLKVISFTRRRS